MTSRTDTTVNRKGKIPWYVYFVGGHLYRSCRYAVLRNRPCLFWHGFAPSVRRWAFTMPGGLGNKINETELMPNRCAAANPTIALWLQSSILVGWVAELGSLESHAPKQDCQMANAALELIQLRVICSLR